MTALKPILKFMLAAFMTSAGVMHFFKTDFYLKMMPPYVPWHLEMVYLSGVFEIVLGLLLLIPRTTRLAAWGLIALLVAVFPANVHIYLNQDLIPAKPMLHLMRLPLQAVLIVWAFWFTRPERPAEPAVSSPG
ncbi:MAG: DoxX family protein [Planctomycetaceae bacterium]|nr:DoxX family protein [Planctomycetaceae bacterium]